MKQKIMFMAHIFKCINDIEFKLDAGVPLARHRLFGMGSRKKV
jgi:hypothetical protein